MVYRRVIAALVLSGLMGHTLAQGPVREMEKDRIREDAVADILRVPPWVVEIEPDLAVIRSIFARPITIDQVRSFAEQGAGQVQVLAHRFAITSEQALKLVANTFKYRVVRLDGKDLKDTIAFPNGEASLGELLQLVEEAAGVLISVYPDSELIIVRKK